MKDADQQIAIAKACGWTNLKIFNNEVFGTVPNADELDSQGALENLYHIPDYLNDLNAMHEAEKEVRKDPETELRYCRKLYQISGCVTFATARQRAEAFLKTLNL